MNKIEGIEQAIKHLDPFQIEIKLDYKLGEKRKTNYRVETYFFIPKNLDVNERTYPSEEFYRDTKNYIRVKTPAIDLTAMCEDDVMPLAVIERVTSAPGWLVDLDLNEDLIDNCKLLTAMLKSVLREHLKLIRKRAGEVNNGAWADVGIDNLLAEFIERANEIARRYRNLYKKIDQPNVNAEVLGAYRLTDESVSLLIEETAIDLAKLLTEKGLEASQSKYSALLIRLAESETEHRRAAGYGSILRSSGDNEEYAYRAAVLKKYAASILYLSTAITREGQALKHLLFMLAAGLSMVFATMIAFYFQDKYGTFTVPVFSALVIGYMFKDRIKEISKDLLDRMLKHQIYDRRISIRAEAGGQKLGVLREKVTFMDETDVPLSVLNARDKGHFVELDNYGQSEVIIRYTKDIVLNVPAIKKAFKWLPNVSGLNDITRLDVRPFLNRMAEPVLERLCVEDGKLVPAYTKKVYHINMVAKYSSDMPTHAKLYTRTRLVLSRDGIERVEQISV